MGHGGAGGDGDGAPPRPQVRAFDLVRYRNFRTFTTPRPAQFTCLAVDPSGEVPPPPPPPPPWSPLHGLACLQAFCARTRQRMRAAWTE